MDEPGITPLDDAELDAVVGGNDRVNTDTTTTRLSIQKVWRVPVPIRSTTTSQTRTPFGACVDGNAANCERIGGGQQRVGDCKLDGVDRCWQQKQGE